MNTNNIHYLTVQEAIALNKLLIERYSPAEQIGIINRGSLESAINRPMQTVFGADAYTTIYEKSAALLHSLANNHPFANANKRTAFAAMYLFLRYNGVELTMSQQEAVDFTMSVVLEEPDIQQIGAKIQSQSNTIPT